MFDFRAIREPVSYVLADVAHNDEPIYGIWLDLPVYLINKVPLEDTEWTTKAVSNIRKLVVGDQALAAATDLSNTAHKPLKYHIYDEKLADWERRSFYKHYQQSLGKYAIAHARVAPDNDK